MPADFPPERIIKGNTKVHVQSDDTIDIDVNGVNDFIISANDFTAISGSVISTNTINETTADTGVTIDTLLIKDNTLGSATAEIADAYFGDGAIIYLGDDQDVTLTHVADTGLTLNLKLTVANLTDSALTAGRVVIAGAAGLLADDADMTFATDTLTATKMKTTLLTMDLSQDYVLGDRGGGLYIQGQTSGTATWMELFGKDGDGTDLVAFGLWAKGTPASITNYERLVTQYVTAGNEFQILSDQGGTGTVRPIIIYTAGNTNQLKLNTDGSKTHTISLTSGGTNDRNLEVLATLNDAGAAGGSDLFNLIKGNITETDITGWNTINLIDLQVATVSKFKVDRTGALTLGAGATLAGALTMPAAGTITAATSLALNSPIVTLGTTDRIQFRDAAIYINSAADGDLNIVADTTVRIPSLTAGDGYYVFSSGQLFTVLGNKQIQFRDAGIYMYSAADSFLDVIADGAVRFTTPLTTFSGKIGKTNQATTLAAAAVTLAVTKDFVALTGDGGGNTLATITGGVAGQTLTILFVDALVTITDTDAHTANTVDLSAAFTSADDTTLTLLFDGTSWYETARSVN